MKICETKAIKGAKYSEKLGGSDIKVKSKQLDLSVIEQITSKEEQLISVLKFTLLFCLFFVNQVTMSPRVLKFTLCLCMLSLSPIVCS